ncbi:MAG: amidase [Chloroflexi bacterium]|nr:amidase [Chloroflexota bacterium]
MIDATAQAAMVRRGDVQPIDLVEEAIANIERLNPAINAVITKLYDKARAQAVSPDLPDGPFRGVPLLLKDFYIETAGDAYFMGMKYLRDLNWTSSHDTYLARKFKDAGFIILGKTNLPELAGSPTTEPQAFGPTHNPWHHEHSAGGSSGGSAAAVAAGMVAVAHGNDGTGSLRIPASCCGLVGLKPTRGRISTGPKRSGGMFGNISEFVLTKTVRDAAGILDALHGNMPGDLFLAPPPRQPFLQSLQMEIPRLRIGLLVHDPFLGFPVHDECKSATENVARQLEGMGHIVEYSYPAILDGRNGLGPSFFGVIAASGKAAALDRIATRTGMPITEEDVEPPTWETAQVGRSYSAVQVQAAHEVLVAGACSLPEWWASGFDLLITPTMIQPPPKLGLTGAEDLTRAFGLMTMPFSFSGQPAISLPVHWTENGLPVGVQMVADIGREDLLLAVAFQLEQMYRWDEHF